MLSIIFASNTGQCLALQPLQLLQEVIGRIQPHYFFFSASSLPQSSFLYFHGFYELLSHPSDKIANCRATAPQAKLDGTKRCIGVMRCVLRVSHSSPPRCAVVCIDFLRDMRRMFPMSTYKRHMTMHTDMSKASVILAEYPATKAALLHLLRQLPSSINIGGADGCAAQHG